jgi:hypothetical protein
VAFGVARFEEFELDCGRYELRQGDRVVKLEKIPMEILTLLIEANESGGRTFSSIPSTASTPLSAKSGRRWETIQTNPATSKPSPEEATGSLPP